MIKTICLFATETNEPTSSNGSLKVDIKPDATVEEIANSPWRVISADFIPVIDITNYNHSLIFLVTLDRKINR